jgi:hypothetical protein
MIGRFIGGNTVICGLSGLSIFAAFDLDLRAFIHIYLIIGIFILNKNIFLYIIIYL